MNINFHGFQLELDIILGDPSELEPRYWEDEVMITGVKIRDEYEAILYLWDKFSDEIKTLVKKQKKDEIIEEDENFKEISERVNRINELTKQINNIEGKRKNVLGMV